MKQIKKPGGKRPAKISLISFNAVFCAFILGVLLYSCSTEELIHLEIAGHPLMVEIADDEESRARGLMNRPGLAANRGMLFVFESESQPSFWMKDTSIPLSLAFIAANGSIRQIEDLEPYSLDFVESHRNILFALEVNRGWFAEKGIVPGDKVMLKNPENLSHRFRLPEAD